MGGDNEKNKSDIIYKPLMNKIQELHKWRVFHIFREKESTLSRCECFSHDLWDQCDVNTNPSYIACPHENLTQVYTVRGKAQNS